MNILEFIWDILSDIYYFFWRPIDRARDYLRGWWRKTNYLPTGLKPQSWIDKTHTIPEALFYAVDHFVSKDGEDAFSTVSWSSTPHHIRAKSRMIHVLHWYHVERPCKEKRQDEIMKQLYSDKSFCVKFEKDGSLVFPQRSLEEKSLLRELHDLEVEIDKKNTYYSKMVGSIVSFLWT